MKRENLLRECVVMGIYNNAEYGVSIGLCQTVLKPKMNKSIQVSWLELPSTKYYETRRTFFINGFTSEEQAKNWLEEYGERLKTCHIKYIESYAPINVGGIEDEEILKKVVLSQRVKNPVDSKPMIYDGKYKFRQSILCEQFEEDEVLDGVKTIEEIDHLLA